MLVNLYWLREISDDSEMILKKTERPLTSYYRHMVSALVSGSSGPGSSPGRGHCVVFLGKTFYSHSASLHPDV